MRAGSELQLLQSTVAGETLRADDAHKTFVLFHDLVTAMCLAQICLHAIVFVRPVEVTGLAELCTHLLRYARCRKVVSSPLVRTSLLIARACFAFGE